MKTLILNGSPRKHGDTVSLIEKLKSQLSGNILQIDAYYADISPCIDCRSCRTRPGCAIKDGMQEVYGYIRDCDNIVIASPIYFSEITGRLLDVCSRLQTYYCGRFFRGETIKLKPKKGAVILVGGGDGDPEKAEGTSRCLMRHMGCTDFHPLVLSHKTDRLPAAEDAAAADGIRSLSDYFNRV